MSYSNSKYLSQDQLFELLADFDDTEDIEIIYIRYRQRQEIHTLEKISFNNLKELIVNALDEGHIFGGDIQINLLGLSQKLIGHHDGIFWLAAL
ncbi:hypothetical protein [Alkanindiges illinoisensis]|uniref:hypothetical protein n=1 Tax=Alkanindiges illinoisensis TaxID=197183 RepID=UPI00047C528E|nr:hypothetical protein [Alkanindiges illinoisensis]